MEAGQPVHFSWEIQSLTDVLGLIGIIAVLGIIIVLVVSIVSKNGIQIGWFRAGLRKQKGSCPAEVEARHEEILTRLTHSEERLIPLIDGIYTMQQAQNVALDVILGNLEGEEVNGQVRKARLSLTEAIGFQKATIKEQKELV